MKTLPRVLIADDTPDLLRAHVVALNLSPPQIRAEGAATGQEALTLYAEAKEDGVPFDLLILDLAMPGMNGFTVAEKIRADGDDQTRILFFTNFDSDIENDVRARACDAVGVWCKTKTPHFRRDVLALLSMTESDFQKQPAPAPAPPPLHPPDAAGVIAKMKVKREKGFALVAWVLAVAMVANIGIGLFNMARAPRVYSAISSIDRKLDGAVSTHALPAGYRVIVPSAKGAFKAMSDGSARVTFQFEPKDAAAAASMASERGETFYLSVTRGK